MCVFLILKSPRLLFIRGLKKTVSTKPLLDRDSIDFSNPYAKQCIQVVNEEYHLPDFNMENVAKKLNISRGYLSSKFKTETGLSFPQYLNKIRIEKAKVLLKTTPLRISEIAQRVGFTSAEHFSSKFHQIEKISPSDYKKS